MGNHGEAAAGGTNPGGKSLFQEATSSQTADARPLSSTPLTKGLSCRIQFCFVLFLMKLFKQSLNISSLSVFILSNVPHHATLQTEKTMQDNSSAVIDVITWFCPAEGTLTALFGMLLGTD